MTALVEIALDLLWQWIFGWPYASKEAKQAARAEAEQQLRDYKSDTLTGMLASFEGATCEVLHATESLTAYDGAITFYVLTQFVVTPENQYFLLKSNGSGSPFLKPLSPQRAKAVLKQRFRPHSSMVQRPSP